MSVGERQAPETAGAPARTGRRRASAAMAMAVPAGAAALGTGAAWLGGPELGGRG